MKLNQYLQPVDSIPATSRDFMTALDFDSRFEKGVISNSQLLDQNVTSEKLSEDAISGDILADSAVTTVKLDSEAVTTAKIAGSAVTTVKIDALAVTDAKINDFNFSKGSGTITGATFNGGTIGTTLITAGTANNQTMGTPAVTGGTFTAPILAGTAIYPVQSGSAALSANNQFLFQINAGGSAILTVRTGGTTFYFNASGVI